MHALRLLLPLGAASFLSGCGLVAVPSTAELPPSHFRSIVVREAGTRRPLSTASVRYEVERATNWTRAEPPLAASLVSGSATWPSLTVPATSAGGGRFVFAPVRRTEWAHILFPIGLPLGGVRYHFLTGSLLVSAPGHSSVRIAGRPPALRPSPLAEHAEGLTVLLPRGVIPP